MCEDCQKPEEMERWGNNIVKHDGSYPDPIDNSPCDTCFKVK